MNRNTIERISGLTAVQNAYADNMYERSELDYLIYNDPEAYAELILAGETENYLKAVTQYGMEI